MTVMNFDLEDGLPPVSFDLKPADAERFAAFMAECYAALAAARTPPELGRDSSRAIELLNELSPESQVEVLDYIRTMFPATPPAQEQAELPKLVVYKSTSIPEEQWRNEPIDYWLRGMLRHCDYHDGLVIKATLAFLEGLKPAQAHIAQVVPLQEQPEVTVTTTVDEWCEHCGCGSDMYGYAHLELCPTQTPTLPPQDEPVASLYVSRFRGHLENTQFEYLGDLPDGTYNLYTHPADDKLRKAAEEVANQFVKLEKIYASSEFVNAVRNLRAALDE